MTGEELSLRIRMLLLREGGMTEAQAAELLGVRTQDFHTKMKAGSFSYLEVAKLLTGLEYKIRWEKEGT